MTEKTPKSFFLTPLLLLSSAIASRADDSTIKVFILAGQSNMEGQAVVDLDHEKYYNGGKGNLEHVMKHSPLKKMYSHLKDAQGNWIVRDDVWVRYKTERELKKGKLSIGYAVYGGKNHFGPEMQFGHVIGDYVPNQVLLIKTAWGGKSLYKDFRPPSAGGEVGVYYKRMLAEVDEAFNRIGLEFSVQRADFDIAGFVWFQGWNDMYNETARNEYEQNLVHLINDVRTHHREPNLPVVIGELGNGGPKASANMIAIREAQAAVAKRSEFKGTVVFVKTTDFARPKEQSPNVGHGHHWFGNAESYFLIGNAMGEAMKELLE